MPYDHDYDHEYCIRELRQLNEEWQERYWESRKVKRVSREDISKEGKVMHVLQVLEIISEPDGLTIIVR